jgi:hypothetical protein
MEVCVCLLREVFSSDANTRLNRAILALTSLCVLFFMLGCLAYSDDMGVLGDNAWFQIIDSGGDYYGEESSYAFFGLVGYAYIDTYRWSGARYGVVKYADCSEHFCKACDSAGGAAFAFTLIATLLATTVLIMASQKASKSVVLKPACSAVLSAFLAMCIFMGQCLGKFSGASWGSGSVLVLVAMILMCIVIALITKFGGVGGTSVQPGAEPELKDVKADCPPDRFPSAAAAVPVTGVVTVTHADYPHDRYSSAAAVPITGVVTMTKAGPRQF